MPSSPLSLPAAPPSLKAIGHYLKTANEHETRDPVITYWCRLSALQNGLKLDKKSKEALALLLPLMDWLEKEKKVMSAEEAVTNEVVASAHVENYAVKLFLWADKEDRASHFNKNVVKSFYSCGILFDVLTICTQSELTPENAHMRKYAKWKAAYIHNCLKNGETPIPGPMEGDDEDAVGGVPESGFADPGLEPQIPSISDSQPIPAPRSKPSQEPVIPAPVPQVPVLPQIPQVPGSSVKMSPDINAKAQKYCKYATSALDYDDSATAILNLTKALKLLQTGEDN